ncbi:MAG: hypothetical protein GY799_31610 [Desulfobulbaceae bacterium]|nr:hypothetical protein [Desulfobulbaceae bacterium]
MPLKPVSGRVRTSQDIIDAEDLKLLKDSPRWGEMQKEKKWLELMGELDKFSYKLDPVNPGDVSGDLNVLGQQVAAAQTQNLQSLGESMAARTGGRLGEARGTSEVGGKAALTSSMGVAEIFKAARNRQLQTKRMELDGMLTKVNAYVQKYGIDRHAEIALANLRQQRKMMEEQAQAGLLSDLFSFVTSGGGDGAAAVAGMSG